MDIKSVGVIGAGQMGLGIAHAVALVGYEIKLYDVSAEQREKAKQTIASNLEKTVKKGNLSEEEKNKTLERITLGDEMFHLEHCDLVIEAASEKEAIKKSIFEKLSTILKPNAYIVSNTSSISPFL